MPVKIVSFLALVSTLLVLPLLASDWGQWRGPSRTGVSTEKGLADQWPAGGPRLVWQVKDIGDGYGSATVAGDRVYVLGNEGVENEFVQALDKTNGRQVWRVRIGKVGNPDQSPPYPAARSTPTLDGNLIFAFGSDGDLACLEAASGNIRWKKNVRQEFGGKPGTWAYCESPLVDGEVVMCSPGGLDAPMVAFDKNTGSVIWKAQIPQGDDAGYASAIKLQLGGNKQYVQFLAKGLVGIDAANGQMLWRYDGTGSGPANMATPVAMENLIYTPGQAGSAVVKLTATGSGVQAEEVYRVRGLPNAIGGAVEVGGYLYGTTRNDGLVCADFKTGDVKWKDPSIGMGAVCSADGLLFVFGENGEAALVEATPQAYREKGRFTPADRPEHSNDMEKSWAYPTVANGRLYLRDKGTLWCYDVSDGAGAKR
jgi:outer membrane protein assembly factor BamB